MAIETERKFLVCGDYKSQAYSSSRIKQGYICSGHGRTVRVRLRDNQGYLTIKGPSDLKGMSRYEFEKEIMTPNPRSPSSSTPRGPCRSESRPHIGANRKSEKV